MAGVVHGVDLSSLPMIMDAFGVLHSERRFILEKIVVLSEVLVASMKQI